GEGLPMVAALTKVPSLPSPFPQLDLCDFQRDPGRGREPPVDFCNALPRLACWVSANAISTWIHPIDATASRRRHFAGEISSTGKPHGHCVTLHDAESRMHRGCGTDLHGRLVGLQFTDLVPPAPSAPSRVLCRKLPLALHLHQV